MALQWTFVAGFLYVEIGFAIILLLPFVSPSTWQKLFRSRLVSSISEYSYIYFNVFIAILLLLFVDSIREVRKYSGPTDTVDLKHHPEAEHLAQMKLFRAQRNFYITGFALFLWFILRRLINLTAEKAKLLAELEAAQKQARSATDAAKRLLDESTDKGKKEEKKDEGGEKKSIELKLDETKQELVKTKDELKRARLDLESLKSQAEGTNKEYDRLLKEHAKLQEQVNKESKKDN